MVFDRSGSIDPRNERKEIVALQEEITASLSRIANNTDQRRTQQGIASQEAMSYFKAKEQKSSPVGGGFFREKEVQDENFKTSSKPEKTRAEIINFRDGLIIPIQEYFDNQFRERMNYDLRLHREKIFQLRMIDRKVQALIPKGDKTYAQRMREGFNDFLKAPIIKTFKAVGMALANTLKGVFIGSFRVLFGARKRGRTELEAIDEQTEFLRKGFIDRDRNFFEKIKDGGLLGSTARAGFGALTGLSESTARQAEERRAQGKQLSLIERAAKQMHKSNISLLDMGKGRKQTEQQMQEVRNNTLNAIFNTLRVGFESIIQTTARVRDTISVTSENMVLPALRNIAGLLDQAKVALGDYSTPLNTILTQQIKGNEKQEELLISQKKTANTQNDLLYETEKSNSPWMTPFEEEMLGKLDQQNNLLQTANDITLDSTTEQKRSSGGLLGMMGMGAGWLGSKLGPMLSKGLKKATPYVTKLLGKGKWLLGALTGGSALAVTGAAIGGTIVGTLVNGLFDYIDDNFGTSIGHWIGKITYHIVEGVTNIWENANTYITWLGNNFTEVIKIPFIKMWEGAKAMGDWISEKVQSLPWIGQWFEGEEGEKKKTFTGNPGIASRGPASVGPSMPPSAAELEEVRASIERSNNETRKEKQREMEETKKLRDQMFEQNERTNKLLEQINGSSAATAAKAGGDPEEKLYMRKEQQFSFD